jgi:hypothetical protein
MDSSKHMNLKLEDFEIANEQKDLFITPGFFNENKVLDQSLFKTPFVINKNT